MLNISVSKSKIKYIIIAIGIISIIYGINKMNIKSYGPDEIKEYVNSFGVLSPIVYVLILTILPLAFFPDPVIFVAGGMMFGLVQGIILSSIGALLAATAAFYIARYLGQRIIGKFIKGKLVNFEKHFKRSGFLIILMLRIIPIFPSKIVSYSAGLANIKFKDFIKATTIGVMPGIIVYTNLGDKCREVESREFFISIILVILLFLLSFILKKKICIKD